MLTVPVLLKRCATNLALIANDPAYVAAAAQDVVGEEMSLPNLDATAGLTIRKLMQLSRTAEEQGDLKLVLSIQKSIAQIVSKRIKDQEVHVAKKLEWFA